MRQQELESATPEEKKLEAELNSIAEQQRNVDEEILNLVRSQCFC